MDCSLKKLASFFKFFVCILERSPKTDYNLLDSSEKLLNIFFQEKVLCQVFGVFVRNVLSE